MVKWLVALPDDAQVVWDTLPVRIANYHDAPLSVDLGMRGTGLDQRIAYSSIGHYRLAARETRIVHIPVQDLPVQSVGAPSQVELVGTSTGPEWPEASLAADHIFVQFASDYAQAFVSPTITWAPVALALVDGDIGSTEYLVLRDEPVSAVKRHVDGVATDELDELRALELYERVVGPAMRARGRYLDVFVEHPRTCRIWEQADYDG